MKRQEIIQRLKHVSPASFEDLALAIFHYQIEKNEMYRSYVKALNRHSVEVKSLLDIPFLPISFFKTHSVRSFDENPISLFESSSTTGQIPSKHWVLDRKLYEWSFLQNFILQYGHPSQYRIVALLPSYLERGNSSLVYMVEYLMKVSGHPHNAFFLHDFESLDRILSTPVQQPTLLVGVTFALLDFSERYPNRLSNTIVLETGGMKGRGREPIREEVHSLLKERTHAEIHSEYGMTELFSQAYAKESSSFLCPPWMQVLTREVDDPLKFHQGGGRGALNIIDLANVDSCAFIATDDLGEVLHPDEFKVLGRISTAETRGCSLLYA